MTRMRHIRASLALITVVLLAAPSPASAAHWVPVPDVTWQIQFSGAIDLSVNADVYDLDMVGTTARQVRKLHERGRKAICYINAGAWENWRPDADRYPSSVKGNGLDGWPGERWLDIRRLDVIGPILVDRLELCRAKGFDGVEFDNVDGYMNGSGFNLSRSDQLAFNRWLADAAHDIADELEPDFDFAIVEQCFFYRECGLTRPFVDAGKAVIVVEYELGRGSFCAKASRLGISAMRKHLNLDAWRRPC